MASAIGLRHPASASCLGAALASCWPLPQQLLPVSAAGGGRRRCALAISRGRIIFNRAMPERLRTLRHCIFTGGVVMVNSICSAAFCESAALRKKCFAEFQRAKPSQSRLTACQIPPFEERLSHHSGQKVVFCRIRTQSLTKGVIFCILSLSTLAQFSCCVSGC